LASPQTFTCPVKLNAGIIWGFVILPLRGAGLESWGFGFETEGLTGLMRCSDRLGGIVANFGKIHQL
jgi:hypothetical protein